MVHIGFEEIKERWHIIDGFEDYAITESGRVYSINNYRCKELRELSTKNSNPNRYLNVHLSKNNKEYTFQIHRLVGKYFVDGYFEGAEIDHKDKNIQNNHYTNLEWVTHQENLHRSYNTLGPVRNFKLWHLIHPDGTISPILKGFGEIKRYIQNNNLNVLMTMIMKHKEHRGYKLIEVA